MHDYFHSILVYMIWVTDFEFCTFICICVKDVYKKFAFIRWWHRLGVYMSPCSLALVVADRGH